LKNLNYSVADSRNYEKFLEDIEGLVARNAAEASGLST
jgi:hypothetical protein